MQQMRNWAARIATGVALVGLSPALWAQVPNVSGDDPRLEPNRTYLLAWGIVVLFGLAILGIAFKGSKRNNTLQQQ